MILSSSATLRKIKFTLVIPALLGLLAAAPVFGEAGGSPAPVIPDEYGEVIYQKEGNGDKHLYIVFQSHRNASTGDNHHNTVEVQAEIYRIGEWLIRHENVGLLLPEGYFNRRKQQRPVQQVAFSPESASDRGRSLDDAALKTILKDTSRSASADRLLMESYGLRLQQVEDQELYLSIMDFLFRPGNREGFDEKDIRILGYMQEMRSAVLLQAIPGAIDRELRQGGINQGKAIFTIGLAHVNEMIRFLQAGKIEIFSPLLSRMENKGDLKLLEADYGVTLILPKSLAEDQEAIKIANLDGLAKRVDSPRSAR